MKIEWISYGDKYYEWKLSDNLSVVIFPINSNTWKAEIHDTGSEVSMQTKIYVNGGVNDTIAKNFAVNYTFRVMKNFYDVYKNFKLENTTEISVNKPVKEEKDFCEELCDALIKIGAEPVACYWKDFGEVGTRVVVELKDKNRGPRACYMLVKKAYELLPEDKRQVKYFWDVFVKEVKPCEQCV